jgi:hypothetical protein
MQAIEMQVKQFKENKERSESERHHRQQEHEMVRLAAIEKAKH